MFMFTVRQRFCLLEHRSVKCPLDLIEHTQTLKVLSQLIVNLFAFAVELAQIIRLLNHISVFLACISVLVCEFVSGVCFCFCAT